MSIFNVCIESRPRVVYSATGRTRPFRVDCLDRSLTRSPSETSDVVSLPLQTLLAFHHNPDNCHSGRNASGRSDGEARSCRTL